MKFPKQIVVQIDEESGYLAGPTLDEFASPKPTPVGIYKLVEVVKISTKVVMSKRKVRP